MTEVEHNQIQNEHWFKFWFDDEHKKVPVVQDASRETAITKAREHWGEDFVLGTCDTLPGQWLAVKSSA